MSLFKQKIIRKAILTLSLILIFFLTLPVLVHAQDDFPDSPGEPDVPFDNGVLFLVAAAISYGIWLWHQKKKESKKEVCGVSPSKRSARIVDNF